MNCTTCKHFQEKREPQMIQTNEIMNNWPQDACRRYPSVPIGATIQNQMTGELTFQIMFVPRGTMPDGICGEYQEKIQQ